MLAPSSIDNAHGCRRAQTYWRPRRQSGDQRIMLKGHLHLHAISRRVVAIQPRHSDANAIRQHGRQHAAYGGGKARAVRRCADMLAGPPLARSGRRSEPCRIASAPSVATLRPARCNALPPDPSPTSPRALRARRATQSRTPPWRRRCVAFGISVDDTEEDPCVGMRQPTETGEFQTAGAAGLRPASQATPQRCGTGTPRPPRCAPVRLHRWLWLRRIRVLVRQTRGDSAFHQALSDVRRLPKPGA